VLKCETPECEALAKMDTIPSDWYGPEVLVTFHGIHCSWNQGWCCNSLPLVFPTIGSVYLPLNQLMVDIWIVEQNKVASTSDAKGLPLYTITGNIINSG